MSTEYLMFDSPRDAITAADLARWSWHARIATETYQQNLNEINVIFDRDFDTGKNLARLWRAATAKSEQAEAKLLPSHLLRDWGALDYRLVGRSTRIFKRVFQAMATSAEGLSSLTPVDVADAFVAAQGIADWPDLLPAGGSQPAGPQPGTVIDVIQAAAEAADVHRNHTLRAQLDAISAAAQKATDSTPSFHDVLRRVGVVDAGALGLCIALQQLPSAVAANRA
jgi:uncharacterized protein